MYMQVGRDCSPLGVFQDQDRPTFGKPFRVGLIQLSKVSGPGAVQFCIPETTFWMSAAVISGSCSGMVLLAVLMSSSH